MADKENYFRTCTPYIPPTEKLKSATHQEMEQAILRFLENGPATIEQTAAHFENCARIGGVMNGMAAMGKVRIDTEQVYPHTKFSIPVSINTCF
jgi:hypothetical protein